MVHAGNSAIACRNRLLTISGLILLAVPLQLSAQSDVTGEWEIKMDRNGRESFATVMITKKADGALTGKWGSTELSDVKLDGQKLTFVRTMKFGDQEFKLNYEGTLKDGSITGTLTSERGNFSANASRKKAKSPVLGQWSFSYKIGDRDINATLAVSEGASGLEGAWKSNIGEHVVSNLKFQDGKLSFARKSKIEGNEFESTYDGVLQGNKLLGTIKSSVLGEIPVTGQRVGAELIGKWDFTTTSDRGPRQSLFTVFNDLTARYELFGGEIPVKELKLEGGQVSFSVDAAFGDQPFKIDFKAKLDGKTLKGEVTSPRGTREVSGKKVDPASAVAGVWEIIREGQNGPRTVKLTIKEDMTGTYSYGENTANTANVTDLRVDGDQLSFKVTVKYNDLEVPMEFKGKVDGATLKGQFTSARGTREATGKKIASTTP